jgi:hypothetical protein
MTAKAERHAAKMRLQNTEFLRRKLWRKVQAQFDARKLTTTEARDIMAEFWNDRRKDKAMA